MPMVKKDWVARDRPSVLFSRTIFTAWGSQHMVVQVAADMPITSIHEVIAGPLPRPLHCISETMVDKNITGCQHRAFFGNNGSIVAYCLIEDNYDTLKFELPFSYAKAAQPAAETKERHWSDREISLETHSPVVKVGQSGRVKN